MTKTGADRGTVKLGTRPASDFEDIAIGPGPDSSKDYLYIADVGNNSHSRSTVRIYRIAEPTPPGAGQTITIPDSQIETFVYAYEKPNDPGSTWKRNAESVIVDPISGDVFIFEKQLSTIDGKSNMAWVYRISKNALVEGQTILAKPKTAVKAKISSDNTPLTGADISVDGKLIVIKNAWETFAWKRSSSQTVVAALAANPVTSCRPPGTWGEAVAILPDGKSMLTVTEKRSAPVMQISIDGGSTPPPPPPPTGHTCDGVAATIVGTSGDDLIFATDGDDVIVAFGGNDTIYGKKGNDIICGGPGDDRIYGNVGNDRLIGADGTDVLIGGYGADFLSGAKGHDRLYGQNGRDYLSGADGNDKLVGGAHSDELQAGPGTDICIGGPGDDDYGGCE